MNYVLLLVGQMGTSLNVFPDSIAFLSKIEATAILVESVYKDAKENSLNAAIYLEIKQKQYAQDRKTTDLWIKYSLVLIY